MASSASRTRVGKQGHLAGVLDGPRDLALLLDGDTRNASSADLAAVRDELAQRGGVLVVDVLDLGRLKRVGLLLGLAKNRLRHSYAPSVAVAGATRRLAPPGKSNDGNQKGGLSSCALELLYQCDGSDHRLVPARALRQKLHLQRLERLLEQVLQQSLIEKR